MQVRVQEFDRLAADPEAGAALGKSPQRLVDIDDLAIPPQQRNAVGDQIERIFKHGFARRGIECKQRSHPVGSLEVRAKAVHQRDLATRDMTFTT